MIEKFGHVRNPLTVIAMFAGLAEVSGTIVLPFLEPATQLIYVWFLMFFPALLVGLFFYTLWYYPENLYAPSDWKDENNWVAARGKAVAEKAADEARAIVSESDAPVVKEPDGLQDVQDQEVGPDAVGSTYESPDGHPEEAPSAELPGETTAAPVAVKDVRTRIWRVMERIKVAESLAIAEVSKVTGLDFKRNVSPSDNRALVFDAVLESDDKTIVVEVRYASSMNALTLDSLKNFISKISSYYESLPKKRKASFLLMFVVVLDGEAEGKELEVVRRLSYLQTKFTVPLLPHVYNLSELRQNHPADIIS